MNAKRFMNLFIKKSVLKQRNPFYVNKQQINNKQTTTKQQPEQCIQETFRLRKFLNVLF